ncbi:MAG: hypothetical protein DME33_09105 [Verrucomicrobia bacterium]|nr:MAG: hypothetical protein DME33_09105 [Verrucomicrobiota bacterium]
MRSPRATEWLRHLKLHGNYEPLIRARHKYDHVERSLADDPAFPSAMTFDQSAVRCNEIC